MAFNGQNTTSGRRGPVKWYALTIFLSSAFLMVLEITAGRLLAPYIGVSLYSWTSIIGVVLAGLSLGNWIGGAWADRGGNERSVGLTLGAGGIFSLAILLFLSILAPVIQASTLDLLSVSFLYVLALFFIPSALLGIVTPLLTTMALRLDARTGHIVGRLHALAALGSIVGTFLTGYWLVQYFGTRNIVLGTAASMFLLAAPFLWRAPRRLPAIILIATACLLAGVTYTRQGMSNPCDRESNYFCIRVVDESGRAPFGQARALVLDHLIHGISHDSEPGMLIPAYMHLMDELVLEHFGGRRLEGLDFFFAGGGSYTQPRAVRALYPDARVTVAELDPAVTQTAIERLFLDPGTMRIFHGDARMVLHRLGQERFDVIVGDVFHDIAIPYHLVTREYAGLLRSRLKPGGLYTLNVVDAFPDPVLVKSLLKTLATEFEHVNVWMESLPQRPERVTFVISASNTHAVPDSLQAQRGFERVWYRVTEPLRTTGTAMSAVPVLTDDAVPVERLISSLLLTQLGR